VLYICREYASRLPTTDLNVWTGLGQQGRRRVRQAERLAELRAKSGVAAMNAAKTVCDHGHDLTSDNVMTITDKSGGRHRCCRKCHRRSAVTSRRLKRQLDRARRPA
jgi:hypothetical protein